MSDWNTRAMIKWCLRYGYGLEMTTERGYKVRINSKR